MHPHSKKFNPLYLILVALLLLGAGVYLEFSSSDHILDETKEIEARLNEQARGVIHLLNDANKSLPKVDWASVQQPFFLIKHEEIVAWSKTSFTPDLRLNATDTAFVLVKNTAGDFLYKRLTIDTNQYLLAVIPLQRRFPISNQYLNASMNDAVFGNLKGRVEDVSSTSGELIKLHGKPIFRFVFGSVKGNNYDYLILILISIGLVALLLGFIIWLHRLQTSFKFSNVFLFSVSGFIAIRLLMIESEYPARWLDSPVFDPQIFASSSYNTSVGDLLINSLGVLVLCIYAFFHYPKFGGVRNLLVWNNLIGKTIAQIILFAGAYFAMVYPFLFVEIIYHNSSILLDITESLEINLVRSLAWISLLIGVISAFLVFHILITLAIRFGNGVVRLLLLNILGGLIFLIYFLLSDHDYWITWSVASTLIALLIIFRLNTRISRIRFDSFVYLFVMLAAFGAQHALSIRLFSEERQIETNLKYATNFITGRDILGEYLLQETSRQIGEDVYIQNAFTNPFVNRSLIKQKIRQVYLSTYFDRYEVKSYLYNAVSPDSIPNYIFSKLLNVPFLESYRTEYSGIYYISPVGNETNKRYVIIIPVKKSDLLAGYAVIDLVLKRIIPDNVYPELLVDNRFAQYYKIQSGSFALIKDDLIINSSGDFDYRNDFDFTLLKNDPLYRTGVKTSSAIHFAVAEDDDRVVVISAGRYSLFNLLTNFSLFFVVGVFLTALILLWMLWVSRSSAKKLNYAARIQLIIFLLFSVPLILATATTLSRVTDSEENQLIQEYQQKAAKLGESFSSLLADYDNGLVTQNDFESEIAERAKQSNVDITVYNRKGKYLGSSQPLIFENQLSSTLLNPLIWKELNSNAKLSLIEKDEIGSLKFNNSYQKIVNGESGEVIGVLSVPFFDSESSLEETKINVLSNFLTIFTIIFILFSILSFYIVNWLTFPLQFITKALSKTTLTGENKPLLWNSTDEIGLMVNEYNRMVTNLEQSKIDLARIQKETAWREIARQVAHEIKNPLTPMKLTLQQMEHQLIQNSLDPERVKKAIKSLLAQIEILNEIASSFSTFARMPAPIMQRIELMKILKECVNLHAGSEHGEVAFSSQLQQVFVMGDEQLLNRIFSNLILNALQSGHGDRVEVSVNAEIIESQIIISVRDTGAGIDEEMADKIFLPYFSTKKSGSGLGLAISKQGIEQSGGEIWFESQPGKGTTFFVKLPLA